MQAKRLYEMGGDITSNFYPSSMSGSAAMLSDGKRPSKKAKSYNKRCINPRGNKCYSPGRNT